MNIKDTIWLLEKEAIECRKEADIQSLDYFQGLKRGEAMGFEIAARWLKEALAEEVKS